MKENATCLLVCEYYGGPSQYLNHVHDASALPRQRETCHVEQ